ncbi:hypothetical protein NC651_017125 [Populus alba x Populus x berolinensis]|nr:hypothetical protein NC651_017125 [Populus alba x Populus x berolinensis]
MYGKCGRLGVACDVFDRMLKRNVVSWTALMCGHIQNGNPLESLLLFSKMGLSGVKPNDFTFSTNLKACGLLNGLDIGRQIHDICVKTGFDMVNVVGNSIIDMYSKCGRINEAACMFEVMPMPARNVISWTVMITGYGKHGLGKEAIRLFDEMQLDSTEPDDVTYLAVLLGCSHSGLVEKGQEYFSRLCSYHGIKARVEHYACMVDLLGRAGRLKEAKNLVDSMPLEANVGIWQTLLSACRVHGDLELGKEVGGILLRLDSENPVNYVMMSNIYADAGYWKECERIRELVKSKKLKKEAGRSWVEIDKEVHFFYGGDDTHPLTEKIHEILKEMERRMKEELGYVYGVKYALHDVEEESKMENLRVHSEKLAIGLALVCGGSEEGRKVIRVFKNLRVCGDCHEFIKGLSKILRVEFVVRDANRFHRFEDGLCSCRDYW